MPFEATFTGQDAVIANTYAKSTLRAVAEDLARLYDKVDYLPSYEAVIHSDRRAAWESDLIHVTDAMVGSIIDGFVTAYIDGGENCDETAPPDGPPDFELAEEGDPMFVAGFPQIVATSSLRPELGPGNLAYGPAMPWHAQSRPDYPEGLEFRFPKPLDCVALWLQAQNRHRERAPGGFHLVGCRGSGDWEVLLSVATADWLAGNGWLSWRIDRTGPWRTFRLVITANAGDPNYLTLQRVWFEPRQQPDAA